MIFDGEFISAYVTVESNSLFYLQKYKKKLFITYFFPIFMVDNNS